MAAHGAIFVLVLLVGLLAPLGLYYLVRAEHEDGAVGRHQPRKTSTMSLEPAVSSRYSSE